MTVFAYVLSSNYNGNRPLRNIFIRVWETRFKCGIVHDFLWLFCVNILVHGFMQFRYIEGKGDFIFAVICIVLTMATIFGLIGFAITQYK